MKTILLLSTLLCSNLLLAQTFTFSIPTKDKKNVDLKAQAADFKQEKPTQHHIALQESREARAPANFDEKQTDFDHDEGAYRFNLMNK